MQESKMFYSTDILIFSVDSRENNNIRELPKKYFSILLVKRDKDPNKGEWCLPGGFVKEDETSFEAAKRVLKKETNLTNVYVEELGIFDEVNRDPRGRIISSSYIALVDKNTIKEELSENAKWFDIEIDDQDDKINLKLKQDEQIDISLKRTLINVESKQYKYEVINSKNIAFDHGLIINKGILTLREKANHSDIIFNLMPEKFTIGELKQVYEIILGKPLVNSAFRRVIASKITPVEETIKTGGHRPSQKFSYKKTN